MAASSSARELAPGTEYEGAVHEESVIVVSTARHASFLGAGVLYHLALACWVWRGEVGCGPGVCVKWRKVEAVAVDATAECFGPSASPVALPRGPAALLHLQGRVGVEGSVRWGPTVARPAC